MVCGATDGGGDGFIHSFIHLDEVDEKRI